MTLLVPRLDVATAQTILVEHQSALKSGADPKDLARPDDERAHVNDTGGRAPDSETLKGWRRRLVEGMHGIPAGTPAQRRLHSATLGRLLDEVIHPIPADAGHDGVWAYTTLCLVPDLIHQRWPAEDGLLAKDRWIGGQVGRDRNYAKSAWRRWTILGELTFEGDPLLGEDEYGALLERSSLARNRELVVAAARRVLAYDGDDRSYYVRALMKRITWSTGARLLDALSRDELERLVEEAASAVAVSQEGPRRAR